MSIKQYVTGFLLLLFFILLLSLEAQSDSTNSGANTINQTSTSGSQTSISGGYSQETTYQGTVTNNNETQNSTNNNSETAVATASSPSMSVYSQSSCVIPLSLGVSTIGIGLSYGEYFIDEQCEARMDAALLNKLNMKVAALARLCQDPQIFYSMEMAGSICPAQGMIGAKAKLFWDTNPELRPDYQDWLKRKKILDKEHKRSMTWNEKKIPSGNITK